MKKLLLSLLFLPSLVFAANTAVLTWTAPTLNTDTTAIVGSITYNVYQGPTGAGKTQIATNISALTYTPTTGLAPGNTACWEVTAVVLGMESAHTLEVCKTFPLSVPLPPSNLSVK